MNGGAAVKYIGIALLIAAGFVLLTLGLAFLLFQLAFGARKTTEKEMFALCAPSRSVVSSTPMLFFNALQPSFAERGVCAANASLHCLIYLSYKSMICWIS